jgi:hypothetical protein
MACLRKPGALVLTFFILVFLGLLLGLFALLLATEVIPCLPPFLSAPFWQCPISGLQIDDPGPVAAGSAVNFTVRISSSSFAVRYKWFFSDDLSNPLVTKERHAEHIFSNATSVSNYRLTVQAFNEDHSTEASRNISVVYRLGTSAKYLSNSSLILYCNNDTSYIIISATYAQVLNIHIGDIIFADQVRNCGEFDLFLRRVVDVNPVNLIINGTEYAAVGLTTVQAHLTDAISDLHLEETILNLSQAAARGQELSQPPSFAARGRVLKKQAKDVSSNRLEASWKPATVWQWSAAPGVTLSLTPSFSFNPEIQFSMEIRDRTLRFAKVDYNGVLNATVRASFILNNATNFTGIVPNIYTYQFRPRVWSVPGAAVPVLIWPVLYIDAAMQAWSESRANGIRTVNFIAQTSGSVQYDIISGMNSNYQATFQPTFTTPAFAINCMSYNIQVSLKPRLEFRMETWTFAIAHTMNIWADRMHPPPIGTLHGQPVTCLCNIGTPALITHGYSALTAGVSANLTFVDQNKADDGYDSQLVPQSYNKLLASKCWASNCGPCS